MTDPNSQFPDEILSATTTDPSFWKRAAEQHAPAVVAQREFLGTERGEWRHLVQRRVQDRIEASDSWARGRRQQKEKSEGIVLPGPVDPGCAPELDRSKYGFYIETDGLSNHATTRSFFVESCKLATNDGNGDFILCLDIPDFFDGDSRPFARYFEGGEYEDRSKYCEGIRHYPVAPCPIRVYVTHKASGLQADLFDTTLGRLWLYYSFGKYDDGAILPMLIRHEVEKDGTGNNTRILHIFNNCERVELHGGRGSGTMAIALFRWGSKLAIRIKVEAFGNNGAGDFFGEKLQFR